MKKLFTSILILISTFTYSQNIGIADLNMDTLNVHILSYMNHVRDSLIPKYEYETKQRYVKRKKIYVTDTLSSTPVKIEILTIDTQLNKAAQNQSSFMLKINHPTHDQYRERNGVTVDMDTVLVDIIKRGKYFNIRIKCEIVQKVAYAYSEGKYGLSFKNMEATEIYKRFAKEIIDFYLYSPNHRSAVLSPGYKNIGISVVYSNAGTVYDTIVFN